MICKQSRSLPAYSLVLETCQAPGGAARDLHPGVPRPGGDVGGCPQWIRLWVTGCPVTLADGCPRVPSRLWSLGVVRAFRSALEPRAKVSRQLPGAPWPGLGAGGFRFAAAGGDVSLLPSCRHCRRRRSLVKLQVGPEPSPPVPGRRLHPRGPAA